MYKKKHDLGGQGSSMSLQYAILGMLDLTGEQSGYDLSTYFDMMAGNVWSADRPQIYRTLAKLHAEVLVNEREDEESGRGRKLYQITEKGQIALQEWLESDWELVNYRDPNLLKLFFGKRVSASRLHEQITNYRKMIVQAHTNLILAEKNIKEGAEHMPDDAVFWQLTLEQGKLASHMLLGWCEITLAKLDEYEAQKQQSNKGE